MRVLFLLFFVCLLLVELCLSQTYTSIINSTWGTQYFYLSLGSTHSGYLNNVSLVSSKTDSVILESSLAVGTISELYDAVQSTCVQVDSAANGEQDFGVYYIYSFSQTIAFYGASVWLLDIGDEPNDVSEQFVKGYFEGTRLFTSKATTFFNQGGYVKWETTEPTSVNETYEIDELQFFFGNLNDVAVSDWEICEIWIYGLLVTEQPTPEPTNNPVSPSNAPTLAPSTSPSQPPSTAPSTAPTEDQCPQFGVTQPCCASIEVGGGYYFRNFTFDIYTGNLVNDSDVHDHCNVIINNQSTQCCANGLVEISTIYVDSNIEIECGSGSYTGIDEVCDVDLYVSHVNSTYYGSKGVSGYNTLYAVDEAEGKWYNCSCNYTVNICESKNLPICDTYAVTSPQTDLCANDLYDSFVGGGEINIQSYSNASIDSSAMECSCDYRCDHCANITKYVDMQTDYTYPGNDDNNTCTKQFLMDCCSESLISFGDVWIDNLTLDSYNALYDQNKYEWECLSGDALCDASSVPKSAEKTLFFSFVYNASDAFAGNYICECGIWYDNCTTAVPTSQTESPSFDPTVEPTDFPTLSPTVYRFSDYDSINILQPCCGAMNASFTAIGNGTYCEPFFNFSICSANSFVGSSSEIVVDSYDLVSAGNCTCSYDIGYWNWTYSNDYRCIDDTIWAEVYDNMTWANMSGSADHETESECYEVCVTDCMAIDECISGNAPLLSNASHELYDIGYSYDWFYNYSNGNGRSLFDACYCYFMYEICVDPTVVPTSEPTSEPTNVTFFNFTSTFESSLSMTYVSISSSESGSSDGADDFLSDPVGFLTDNYYFAMAACGVLFLCLLGGCMFYVQKRQKRKQKAERAELEKIRKENVAYDKAHRPHNPYAMTTMLSMSGQQSNPESVSKGKSQETNGNKSSHSTLVPPKSKVEMHKVEKVDSVETITNDDGETTLKKHEKVDTLSHDNMNGNGHESQSKVDMQKVDSVETITNDETPLKKVESIETVSDDNVETPLKKHEKANDNINGNENENDHESQSGSDEEMHPDAFEFDDDGIDM